MKTYLCEDSFAGLLTALYEAYKAPVKPDKIQLTDDYIADLLSEAITIKTDEDKADRLAKAIKEHISAQALKNVYYVYLSENHDRLTLIYQYLAIGWKLREQLDNYLTNEIVLATQKIARKVGLERHRFHGLVRFAKDELTGVFIAEIEPDNNILPIIASHFAERFRDQDWIIADRKRDLAIIYSKVQRKWLMLDSYAVWFEQQFRQTNNHNRKAALNTSSDNISSVTSNDWEGLWRTYFQSASIKERTNHKLQRSFMPKRYWQYLTELND